MPTLEAAARYCPACGAPPQGSNAERSCSFCGAPRLPLGVPDPRTSILCGSCGTAMPGGASFCMCCGGGLARAPAEATASAGAGCPGCGAASMDPRGLAPTADRVEGHRVLSCARCGGVWLPTATRQAMIASAIERAEARPPDGAIPGSGAGVTRRQLPVGTLAAKVVYRRCVECGQPMARRNFGGCSGVVIDECKHGSFFDAGELADVLEFVRSGGLTLAKEREEMERARTLRRAVSHDPTFVDEPGTADVSNAFLRWALRVVRGAVG